MVTQLFFEDVEVEAEIPSLQKQVTHMQLVKYAGAEEDWAAFHVDNEYARSFGLPGEIQHGLLNCAFMAQMMTDWIGLEGSLKKLRSEYRRQLYANESVICRGRVTRKYLEGEQCLVDCEIWIERENGEVTTPGKATVALPSREALKRSLERRD